MNPSIISGTTEYLTIKPDHKFYNGTATIGGNVYSVNNVVTKDMLDNLLKQLSSTPLYQHKCTNCGASVEFDSEKHIFKCPYCNSVYVLGSKMTRDEVH